MPDATQVVVALARVDASGGGVLLGTGFGVSHNLVATCHHVVGGDDKNLYLLVPQTASVNDYQRTDIDSFSTMPLQLVGSDPFRDIALLRPSDPSCAVGFFKQLADSDALLVGDPLNIWGYPHSVDWGRVVLTQQNAIVGAKVLLDCGGLDTKHIVINTQSRPGQSGSPIISQQAGGVVAMLTGSAAPPGANGGISLGGVNPHTLHQTTNAVSAEYIGRMVANV